MFCDTWPGYEKRALIHNKVCVATPPVRVSDTLETMFQVGEGGGYADRGHFNSLWEYLGGLLDAT